MLSTIKINDEVKQKLELKSIELGVNQIDLLNKYVIDGINRDTKYANESKNIEEIKKLLENDLPEGDIASKNLIGLVNNPTKTDSVQLKKETYYRDNL